MMGVKTPLEHKTVVPKRIRLRVAKNFIKELKNVNKNMEWLNGHFEKVEAEYRAEYSEDLSIKDTLKLFDKIAGQLFPHWDITLINDMYTFLNVGILKKRLGNKANQVISNVSNLESMKPIRELVILAHDKDLLSEKGYQKACADYILRYGDRSLEELKLESATFRTNPELLEANIEAYRSDMEKLEATYTHLKKDKTNASLPRGLLLKGNVKRCAEGIRNREKSRLNRARIFGMVREMMLHIGTILCKEHKIDAVEDIFYLTIDEVKALPKGEQDLKSIITERKKQYELFAHLPAYTRLIFAEHEFDKNHDSVNSFIQERDSRKLHGTPCSSGKVSGEALIIEPAKIEYDTRDKILVTRSTDPGWVFMLARSKGVISERGSLLSHTAIISRELNIPSVVGVHDATKIIKNGDHITLDGEKGTITIEEKV
jgi:pyruvate,water dikinase